MNGGARSSRGLPKRTWLVGLGVLAAAASISTYMALPGGAAVQQDAIDQFPNTHAVVVIQITEPCQGAGSQHVAELDGPTTVRRSTDPQDPDGDGLESFDTEMLQMDLMGMHPMLGEVAIRESPTRASLGLVEENQNARMGEVEFPADSFFDVFTELTVMGMVFHNKQPIRVQTTLHTLPPQAGDTYEGNQPVRYFDENDNPTCIVVTRVKHQPVPPETVLNHFTCYRVAPTNSVGVKVQLRDQFGADERTVKLPSLLCNPVRKERPDGQVTEPVNPLAHLKCYGIRKREPLVTRRVHVQNQFAPLGQDLGVKNAIQLCAPALKNPQGGEPPPSDLKTDHFKCYPATGRGIGARVRLTDQFGSGDLTVLRPVRLCNPVDKRRLDTGEEVPRQFPGAHLVCYRLEPNPVVDKTVVTVDQFRKEQVRVGDLRELCVPSDKRQI